MTQGSDPKMVDTANLKDSSSQYLFQLTMGTNDLKVDMVKTLMDILRKVDIIEQLLMFQNQNSGNGLCRFSTSTSQERKCKTISARQSLILMVLFTTSHTICHRSTENKSDKQACKLLFRSSLPLLHEGVSCPWLPLKAVPLEPEFSQQLLKP